MNILLIYPKYPATFWSFEYILKFISKKAAFPPLGLLTISSMLAKEWSKKLIDLNVDKLSDKDIEWADMVFISAMIVQKENAKEIITRCKQKNKTIVAGGPVFTTQYQDFKDVDHFILNEAEITLPLFLNDLKMGSTKKIYTSKQRPNLSHTPIPDWNLIDFRKYATMLVQYSRGCPFNCEFCDIVIMNGRYPRTKSTNQIITELQSLYDAGWKGGVFIVDDNFIGNKINVKNMLPELIKWQRRYKHPFNFLTEASIDLADDNRLMKLMVDANFNSVFLGLETPDIDTLKECSKLQNTTRNVEFSIKKIQKSGMQVMGGFIVGFDNDKDNIFDRQIEFIQKTGIVTAMVGILQALPKTRLWNRLKNENRLLNNASGENSLDINFIPKMDMKLLKEGYEKIIKTIYSPKNYYKRIYKLMETFVPKTKKKFNLRDFYAFLQSIWKIGIFSKSRFEYWKLILKTITKKKKHFSLAVELAIYGHHFEKVCRKQIKTYNEKIIVGCY